MSKLIYGELDSHELKLVTDIFKRIQITLESKINKTAYYPYAIKESDTPEILAYNYYGSAEYHWLILLTNEMIDPNWDWPMNDIKFEKYLIAKYGSLAYAYSTIHHHETLELSAPSNGPYVDGNYLGWTAGDVILDGGIYCNSDFSYSVTTAVAGWDFPNIDCVKAVTLYEYEWELNEDKRKIRVVDKQYLSDVVQQFNALADESRYDYRGI